MGARANGRGRGALMRVLVTGATGFVASHLVPALARDGHEVIALGHDRARLPDGVEQVEADLRTARRFPDADAIVHLAQANVLFPDGADDLFAVNTASTAALLEHARRCGASHFVFTSSASIYGFGDHPFAEDDMPRAVDFYSATKLASERLVGAYAEVLATTALRLVAPFGAGQRGRLIATLAERVREGRPITLNDGGRPRMNPVHVSDVVETIAQALQRDAPALLNVAGDDVVSIRELGELLGELQGVEPTFESGGSAPGDLVAANERLHEFLGRPPLPLRAGLERTLHAEARA
jgi:nucleoside-diphosphate-sugar epimerase